MKSILFVCLGNICRSPLAEGIAREIIRKHNLDIEIDSAGTSGWHSGEEPHYSSCLVAKNNGFSIDDLRSRKLYKYDDRFELIIVMDKQNYNDVISVGFDKSKVVKLGDYGLNGEDIPDPYYLSIDGFDRVYLMIKQCVENLLGYKL